MSAMLERKFELVENILKEVNTTFFHFQQKILSYPHLFGLGLPIYRNFGTDNGN